MCEGEGRAAEHGKGDGKVTILAKPPNTLKSEGSSSIPLGSRDGEEEQSGKKKTRTK